MLQLTPSPPYYNKKVYLECSSNYWAPAKKYQDYVNFWLM